MIVKVTNIRGNAEYTYAIATFDTDNHWESVKQYRAGVDTLMSSYTFATNPDGYIRESKTFNSLGENTRTWYYDIDENNRTTALKIYFSPDSLLSTTKYSYNEKGFNTSVEFENSKGVTNNWKVEYSDYDDMDNWLTCTITLKDGQKIILERKYVYY